MLNYRKVEFAMKLHKFWWKKWWCVGSVYEHFLNNCVKNVWKSVFWHGGNIFRTCDQRKEEGFFLNSFQIKNTWRFISQKGWRNWAFISSRGSSYLESVAHHYMWRRDTGEWCCCTKFMILLRGLCKTQNALENWNRKCTAARGNKYNNESNFFFFKAEKI
jgi:hypothetical protein